MDEADQSEHHKITGNEYYRLNAQSVVHRKSWYRTSRPSRLFYLREKNNFYDPKQRTSNAFVGPVPRKETEHGGDLIHSLQNFDDIFLAYRTR